jgi:branched-subunit amino acid transport protein
MEATVMLWRLVGAGLLTFALRLSFIGLLGQISMPGWFQRLLRLVPVAVFSAIIVPEVLSNSGAATWLGQARPLAGMLALAVAWRTKNVLLTVGVGMACLWILQALPEW